MWWHEGWCRQTILSVLAMGLLAGCGLQPLYGGPAASQVQQALAATRVEAPRSRLGAVLRMALREELEASGPPTDPPRYLLRLSVERRRDPLMVQLDDSITRYEVTVIARYELVDLAQNRLLLRSAATQVASFNVVRQPYADTIAERDAEERAARELGRAVRNRLALFFAGGSF